MAKPRVFIGSSSEGLPIAEAVFECIGRQTEPTLWSHGIFTPGAYPMEALEKTARQNSFAVLAASPDDELIKRGVEAPVMRDNLLVEFGLFAGSFGRKRVFFVCPDQPKLDMPSDLLGIVVATFESERAKRSPSDRSAAVQSACLRVRDSILEQWTEMQRIETEREARARSSQQSNSLRRLYSVSIRLRDSLLMLQRDFVGAFANKDAFESVKQRSAAEIKRIANEFNEDATVVGIPEQLHALASATYDALIQLPFPEELMLGIETRQKMMHAGVAAVDQFLRGGDPVGQLQRDAQVEASERVARLAKRYGDWWDRHSRGLQDSATAMHDGLFEASMRIRTEQLARADLP